MCYWYELLCRLSTSNPICEVKIWKETTKHLTCNLDCLKSNHISNSFFFILSIIISYEKEIEGKNIHEWGMAAFNVPRVPCVRLTADALTYTPKHKAQPHHRNTKLKKVESSKEKEQQPKTSLKLNAIQQTSIDWLYLLKENGGITIFIECTWVGCSFVRTQFYFFSSVFCSFASRINWIKYLWRKLL